MKMTGYDFGINLETATIADQFQWNVSNTDEEPLDNQWNDTPQASNSQTDRVTGSTLGGFAFNWYYRNSGGIFDPLDGGTTSPIIFPQQDVASMVDCNDITNRQSRNIRFGKVVGDSLNFTSYEAENTWLAQNYTYLAMKNDSTIMYQDSLTDGNFITFFNKKDTSNIGSFFQVENMTSDSSSRSSVSLLNASIIPGLDFETSLQTVFNIYLNVYARGDTLSQTDSLNLEQIAYQDYYTGGRAIYLAAAMLGKEITPTIPQLRIMPNTTIPVQNEIGIRKIIKVYPNPATNYFSISGVDQTIKELDLYDTQMKQIRTWVEIEPNSRIPIHVRPGLYGVRIVTQNEEQYWVKLVIMGN